MGALPYLLETTAITGSSSTTNSNVQSQVRDGALFVNLLVLILRMVGWSLHMKKYELRLLRVRQGAGTAEEEVHSLGLGCW